MKGIARPGVSPTILAMAASNHSGTGTGDLYPLLNHHPPDAIKADYERFVAYITAQNPPARDTQAALRSAQRVEEYLRRC